MNEGFDSLDGSFMNILRWCFEKFKENAFYYIGILVGYMVLQFIPIIGFLNIFNSPGINNCFIKLMRDEEVSFRDFFWSFQSLDNFINFLVTYLLSIVFILVGLILLILPGIYMGIALVPMTTIIVMEKHFGLKNIKRSLNLIKGHFWDVSLFMLGLAMLNIVGLLCLGVGLFVTIPMTTMMIIRFTQFLISQKPIILAEDNSIIS